MFWGAVFTFLTLAVTWYKRILFDMQTDQSTAAIVESLINRLDQVETKLRAFEDEKAILDLLSRYSYFADSGRDDDWVDLFTEDGLQDVAMGSDSAYAGGLVFQGTQGLKDFISDPKGHHAEGFYRHSVHLHGNNTVINVDGDTAVANTYSVLMKQDGPGIAVLAAGFNEWEFRRVDGTWRIVVRRRRQAGSPETDMILSKTH
ncbi:hypothetical protein BH09ACT10_BH09ACT10_20140 [soil metagenome]